MELTKMAPLQILAKQVGQSAQDGWPIAIHIAGPRRPSVFFHMPDMLFLNKPLPTTVGENGLILERGEPEEILKFVSSNSRGRILTDSDRGKTLMQLQPKIHLFTQLDRWQILEFDASRAAP